MKTSYRQVGVEKIKKQTVEMTRNKIQKSVVILSVFPLFGFIQAKLSVILIINLFFILINFIF